MQRCHICNKFMTHTHHMTNKWIGVDFDGTLAYNVIERNDPYTLGEPIPTMVNRVKEWIKAGYEVRILTARMNPISHTAGEIRDIEKMEKLLKAWCLQHVGTELSCTACKDGLMEVIWDDRAVHFDISQMEDYK